MSGASGYAVRRLRRILLIGVLTMFAVLAGPAAAAFAASDLAIEQNGPSTATPGGTLSYAITLSNLGPDDPGVTVGFTDGVPAGTTFTSLVQTGGLAASCTTPAVGGTGTVECSTSSIGSGGTLTFTLVVTVDGGTSPGTFITNVANVSVPDGIDPNDENNSAVSTALVPSGQTSDAGLTMTAPSAASPDDDVPYAVTITNAGPDPAGSVSFSTSLPGDMTFVSLQHTAGPAASCSTPASGAGGSVSCVVANMPAGSTVTLTLTGHLPAGAVSGTEYSTTAHVTTSSFDPNGENDDAMVTTVVSASDLAASIDGPASGTSGHDLTYTFSLTNVGPDAAFGARLTIPLPSSVRFTSLTQDSGPTLTRSTPPAGSNGTVGVTASVLSPGQTATFTLVVRTTPATASDSIALTATSSAETNDNVPGNDEDTATTALAAVSADVAPQVDGPTAATAGTDLTYTLTLANDGPDVALGAALSDVLPNGTTFVSLAHAGGPVLDTTAPAAGSGGTVTLAADELASGTASVYTLVVHLDVAAVSGTLTNVVTAGADSADPVPTNDGDSVETAITGADVNLVVDKAGPQLAVRGTTITYEISVANAGPGTATDVTLTDALPAGLRFASATQTGGPAFTLEVAAGGTSGAVRATGQLGTGEQATFTIDAAVAADVTGGATIVNTAVATTTSPGDAPGDSSDDATSTVAVPDVTDPVPPPGPPTPPGEQPPVPRPPVKPARTAQAVLGGSGLTLSSAGAIRLGFTCRGTLACRGSVSIKTSKPTRVGGKRGAPARIVKLGSAAFRGVQPGKRGTATVKLSRKARAIVRELGRVKVVVTASVANPESRPSVRRTSRTLTLVAKRR